LYIAIHFVIVEIDARAGNILKENKIANQNGGISKDLLLTINLSKLKLWYYVFGLILINNYFK